MSIGGCRGQKEVLKPLELKLQVDLAVRCRY